MLCPVGAASAEMGTRLDERGHSSREHIHVHRHVHPHMHLIMHMHMLMYMHMHMHMYMHMHTRNKTAIPPAQITFALIDVLLFFLSSFSCCCRFEIQNMCSFRNVFKWISFSETTKYNNNTCLSYADCIFLFSCLLDVLSKFGRSQDYINSDN